MIVFIRLVKADGLGDVLPSRVSAGLRLGHNLRGKLSSQQGLRRDLALVIIIPIPMGAFPIVAGRLAFVGVVVVHRSIVPLLAVIFLLLIRGCNFPLLLSTGDRIISKPGGSGIFHLILGQYIFPEVLYLRRLWQYRQLH